MPVNAVTLTSMPDGSRISITSDTDATLTIEAFDKHGAPLFSKTTYVVSATEVPEHEVVSVDHGKCVTCGERVNVQGSLPSERKFVHVKRGLPSVGCAVLHQDNDGNPVPCPGHPDPTKQRQSSVDLHKQLVDLLISNFMPQTSEFDPASNLIVRRGVGSLVEDILRLTEDHYGVNQ